MLNFIDALYKLSEKNIFFSLLVSLLRFILIIPSLLLSSIRLIQAGLFKRNFFQLILPKNLLSIPSICAILYTLPINLITQTNFNKLIKSTDYKKIVTIFSTLNRHDLLTQENAVRVIQHQNPENLEKTLDQLKFLGLGLLNQDNFDLVIQHQDLENLEKALSSLKDLNLLTQDNAVRVIQHQNPENLEKTLDQLKFLGLGLLNQDNFDLVIQHQDLKNLEKALSSLKDLNLLTQDNAVRVIQHQNPENLEKTLDQLKFLGLGLLNQDNFDLVIQHQDLKNLEKALSSLKDLDLLTQDNAVRVIQHQNPENLEKTLHKLKVLGLDLDLLNQENFNLVIQHQDLKNLEKALYNLKGLGLLNQDNFNLVIQHQDIKNLEKALSALKDLDLLTQDNAVRVIQHQDIKNLEKALYNLKGLGFGLDLDLLNQANFNLVIEQDTTCHLADILSNLRNSDLLNQERFNLVINHENPESLALAISALYNTHTFTWLLTQEKFNLVINHQKLRHLACALNILRISHLLTQDNFDLLILYQDVLLIPNTWDYITGYVFNQEDWDAIMRICQTDRTLQQRQNDFRQYVNRNILGGEIHQAAFNGSQNTHATSIHLGTDLTAWLLEQLYFQRQKTPFDTNSQWNDLKNSIQDKEKRLQSISKPSQEEQQALHKTQAALRGIVRGIEGLKQRDYQLTVTPEQKSRCLQLIECEEAGLKENLSIQQIGLQNLKNNQNAQSSLRLSQFIAALYHDAMRAIETQNITDQQEKLTRKQTIIDSFIDAFYEVQRGYNLNADGIDDYDPNDKTICFGGTVNKFCEKLKGMAPTAQQFFVTKQTVQASIKVSFIQKILAHGQSLLAQTSNQSDTTIKKSAIDSLMKMKTQLTTSDESPAECIENVLADETFKQDFIQTVQSENTLFATLNDENKLIDEINTFLTYTAPYLGHIQFDQTDQYGAPIRPNFQKQPEENHTTKEKFKTLFDKIDKLTPDQQNNRDNPQGFFQADGTRTQTTSTESANSSHPNNFNSNY